MYSPIRLWCSLCSLAVFVAAALSAFPVWRPASAQLFDRGTFRLTVNGQEHGVEEFVIQRQGSGEALETLARGKIVLRDGRTLTTTLIASGTALTPSTYQLLVTGADTLEITLSRVGARFNALARGPWGEEAREYRASANTLVLEDGVAHHYFLLGPYLQGGFSALRTLSPASEGEMAAAGLETTPETVEVDGESVASTKIRLAMPDGERLAWFDGSGRLVRVALPARGFVAERMSRGTGN